MQTSGWVLGGGREGGKCVCWGSVVKGIAGSVLRVPNGLFGLGGILDRGAMSPHLDRWVGGSRCGVQPCFMIRGSDGSETNRP
jgi:hypothetical protein